jgi:hypothetical protein
MSGKDLAVHVHVQSEERRPIKNKHNILIPPRDKVIDLYLFINVFEQVENRVIKPL